MSVSSGHAKIKRASKQLMAQWADVERYWRDEQGRRFDKEHLTPLLNKLRAAEEALGHMDGVVSRVRRDCE